MRTNDTTHRPWGRNLLLLAAAFPALAAAATARPYPAPGPADDLRTTLNRALQEHVYLAAGATGAALGGRKAEFEAAAAALDANSVELARMIGSVYGKDAESAFLALWRRHIGFVVDYTTGAAARDRKKQEKAVQDLVRYTQDLAGFLASTNPNLPQAELAERIKGHVLTLKDVIDAQAAMEPGKAYTALRGAAAHMSMIADPLAAAIVKQFPEKFASR